MWLGWRSPPPDSSAVLSTFSFSLLLLFFRATEVFLAFMLQLGQSPQEYGPEKEFELDLDC